METIEELEGLSAAQVEASRRRHGSNVLTPPERDPWWKLLLEKFDDPVIRILIIAAVVALGVGSFHGEYLEGVGILVAILLATTLAFANEYKASREFDLLSRVTDQQAVKVIREGNHAHVPRADVVVGDLVVVETGEEVPADGKLLESVTLLVNESSLTGESAPATKRPETIPDEAAASTTAYPRHVMLRGTMVLDGHGIFEVTTVGDATEIGQTARAAAEKPDRPTPLHRQLEWLSKWIGIVGLTMATLTFAALIVRGGVVGKLALDWEQWVFAGMAAGGMVIFLMPVWQPIVCDGFRLILKRPPPKWLDNEIGDDSSALRWAKSFGVAAGVLFVTTGLFWLTALIPRSPADWLPADAAQHVLTYFMIAVTIIVVAVPEGLAMSVTLSLAYSMRKMMAAKTLVRRMHACETIGAATVICSDKTGTLTKNEMRVATAVFPSLGDHKLNGEEGSDVSALIAEAMSVNATADLSRDEDGQVQFLGSPTEGALLAWLDAQGVDYRRQRHKFEAHARLTFSTERKWMGTIGRSSRNGSRILHAKGAPEVILGRSVSLLTGAGERPLDSQRAEIHEQLDDFQRRGMRTLALAYRLDDGFGEATDIDAAASDLTWLGFVAIADPIRSDVPEAIGACHDAGIQVKMVTGDNPQTAQEVARQIGLWKPEDGDGAHLTGDAFAAMDEKASHTAVHRLKVLSRARPLDKVKLVRTLQSEGEVVAVTGDGINDCGALNYADVGLAMGKTGKAAAQEASDIVLLDDSFATIVRGVMWGRSLYENIQRFILFQLTINVAALAIAFLGPFIGVELPLTVTQMLWVNLIMDTFAALALATEPPHPDVLKRPPRRPNDFIVTPLMAKGIFGVGAAFVVVLVGLLIYYQRDGEVTDRELSQFFTFFVMLQFWNLFNARCLGRSNTALQGLLDNRAFLTIAGGIFLGQVAITQFAGKLFRTVPLSVAEWAVIVATSSLVLWIGEALRWARRRQAGA